MRQSEINIELLTTVAHTESSHDKSKQQREAIFFYTLAVSTDAKLTKRKKRHTNDRNRAPDFLHKAGGFHQHQERRIINNNRKLDLITSTYDKKRCK